MLLFFAKINHKLLHGFSPEVLDALRSYSWPGNLRELRNAIERAAILANSETVELCHLPDTLQNSSSATSRMRLTVSSGCGLRDMSSSVLLGERNIQ